MVLQVKERHYVLTSESNQTAIQGKRKLIWAPCLFVFLRIWGTIRFLLYVSGATEDNSRIFKALVVCHVSIPLVIKKFTLIFAVLLKYIQYDDIFCNLLQLLFYITGHWRFCSRICVLHYVLSVYAQIPRKYL